MPLVLLMAIGFGGPLLIWAPAYPVILRAAIQRRQVARKESDDGI